MSNHILSGLGMSVIAGTTIYGEVQNVSELMATLAKIDTTSHNNVSAVKTSRPGFIDNGEITVELGYTASTAQDGIQTMFYAKTVSTWMIVAPMGASRAWSFSGYVSGCGVPTFDKEGNGKMTFRVQPTGVITALTTSNAGLTTPFLSLTDNADASMTITPTAATATYGYQATADLADTGVKVTATATTGTIYVNNSSATSGVATSAITIGTAAGSVIMIPVVIFESNKVPKIYWIEVTHGYV